jgi:hypothetical protein
VPRELITATLVKPNATATKPGLKDVALNNFIKEGMTPRSHSLLIIEIT